MSDPRAPSRHSFHKVTVPLIALTVTAMLLATGNQDWSHGHGRLATQSVSALPPTMPSAQAQPYSATKIRPRPGGSQLWQQQPNQPSAL